MCYTCPVISVSVKQIPRTLIANSTYVDFSRYAEPTKPISSFVLIFHPPQKKIKMAVRFSFATHTRKLLQYIHEYLVYGENFMAPLIGKNIALNRIKKYAKSINQSNV